MSAALIILAAVLVTALLTAGATAVRSVNRLWLRTWIEQDADGDERAPRFVERPKRLLLGAGTGIMMVAFLAAATLVVTGDRSPATLARDGGALTLALLVFGQLLPRAIARRWAPRLVPLLVPSLRGVASLVTPIRAAARTIARALGRLLAPRTVGRETHPLPPPGLSDILRDGTLEGIGAAEEVAIIRRVLALESRTVGDVMTPRDAVFALPDDLPAPEFSRRLAEAAFSRVPVYRGSLDQLVGVVHVFDVFLAGPAGRPALRPITEARTGDSAGDLLLRMLRARRHLVAVRTPGGRVAGIVTLEDLLEEVVGDIDDEHDEERTGDGAASGPAATGSPSDTPSGEAA